MKWDGKFISNKLTREFEDSENAVKEMIDGTVIKDTCLD